MNSSNYVNTLFFLSFQGDFHSSQCSCDICNLESDKPPQEFLVSPTQNSLLYPDITDSYTLQNFSGGGKFFQEALRRKTGLCSFTTFLYV